MTAPPAVGAAISEVSGCALLPKAIPSPAPAPAAVPTTPPIRPHPSHRRGGGALVEHPEIAAAMPKAMQVARVRFRVDRGGRDFIESLCPPDPSRLNFGYSVLHERPAGKEIFRRLMSAGLLCRAGILLQATFIGGGVWINATLRIQEAYFRWLEPR
jgi:hypothetical protein